MRKQVGGKGGEEGRAKETGRRKGKLEGSRR